jgi:hypothetical protein
MDKPIIFFSHSSKDAEALAKLKDLFVAKTGGAIEVFLSSDGQSIPLGRNWVHRVEIALDSALVMVVFVSPNSLGSKWMYFESGYAYSKGVRVVPVGFNGVDLDNVPPPLGLLQGFNIRSKDSLDNLIHLANEVFNHSHADGFSEEEYRDLQALSSNSRGGPLGILTEDIDQIYFSVEVPVPRDTRLSDFANSISGPLSSANIPIQLHAPDIVNGFDLRFAGVSVEIISYGRDQQMYHEIRFIVDPTMLDINAPHLSAMLARAGMGADSRLKIELRFSDGVEALSEAYKTSARLHDSDVFLHRDDGMVFRDVRFWIWRWASGAVPGVQVDIEFQGLDIPVFRIAELLDLFATKGVIFTR